MNDVLKLLLLGGIPPTALGSAIGAVGGTFSPRGSGFIPGAVRGGAAGLGMYAGGALAGAAGEALGIENPGVRATMGLLGSALGGFGGYEAGRKLTRTRREKLNDVMTDWYMREMEPDSTKVAALQPAKVQPSRPLGSAGGAATGAAPASGSKSLNIPRVQPRNVAQGVRGFVPPTVQSQVTSTGMSAPNYRGARNVMVPGSQYTPQGGMIQEVNPREDNMQTFVGQGDSLLPRNATGGMVVDPRYRTPGASAVGYSTTSNAPLASSGRIFDETGDVTAQTMQRAAQTQAQEQAAQQAQAAQYQQRAVVQQFPAIGQAGTPENQAFVQAYRQAQASGQTPNMMAIAQQVMAQKQQVAAAAPEMQGPPMSAAMPEMQGPPMSAAVAPEPAPAANAGILSPEQIQSGEAAFNDYRRRQAEAERAQQMLEQYASQSRAGTAVDPAQVTAAQKQLQEGQQAVAALRSKIDANPYAQQRMSDTGMIDTMKAIGRWLPGAGQLTRFAPDSADIAKTYRSGLEGLKRLFM